MDPGTGVYLFTSLFFILILIFISLLEVSLGKIRSTEKEDVVDPIMKEIYANTNYYFLSLKFLKFFFIILISIYIYQNSIVRRFFYEIENEIKINNFIYFLFPLLMSFFISFLSESFAKRFSIIKMKKPCFVNTIYRLCNFLSPIIKLVIGMNNVFLMVFGINPKERLNDVSETEIKEMVETLNQKGVFNDIEKDMINSIFSFDDLTAKDIMVSRKDTFKIDIEDDFMENVDEVLESYYSRIPVYENNIDDIIGILNIKDLIIEVRKVGFENIDLRKLLKKPYFVPEMKKIDELFKEMQKLRIHMAILVDEYGGFSGIITIEDMIEEITGDINDEFDDDEDLYIKKVKNNIYVIKGTTEIREINKDLGLNIEENENYDTISAFLIEKLGYIPKETEKPIFKLNNLIFKVEDIKDNRVEKLRLIIN